MAEFKNPFSNKSNKNSEDGERAVDWDEAITWDGSPEYIVLSPGNYEFMVKSYERGHYDGNPDKGKKPCNTVKVTVAVNTEQGEAYATTTFFLKANQMFLVGNFFGCIGIAEKGKSFVPNWEQAVGCKGMAKFTNREYNGNTYNNVSRWIQPE